jgi:2'-5' RNA ligase
MDSQTYYFIGHLIQGEAAEWHKTFSKEISDRFNTWKIYEKIPPHITIFRPFGTENLAKVVELLEGLTAKIPIPGSYLMKDYGKFDDRVIYASIEPEQEVVEVVSEIKSKIGKLPSMPEDDFPIWHPHATLINKVIPDEIRKIWEYVLTLEKPDFTLPFDNVNLFRYGGDKKWMVEKIYYFK